jgi:hypothetical protein
MFLAPTGDHDWDYNLLSPADKLNAASPPHTMRSPRAYLPTYFRQKPLNDSLYRQNFHCRSADST